MISILAPTCLPSSPARKKLKNGILELLGEKGEVKNSYTLFSVTLTCLIFMKAEDGWHVSPLELRLARLSALATSLSLGIQSAKDTIQKLYDCSIVLGVKKDVLESLAERKKLYEIWEKEFATTGRLLDPWSICHIIAWITLDLQGLPSQMGRLLVLPAFLHLYVRENIEGRQLNIPILDRFIEAYHGVIFWDGRPVDLLSLSLSYERIIQRDSTAVRIIENRSKRALRDLPFFLGCRLSENNYRLDNEITRYLNVDGTDYLKLLHEVHSVLHSQTESFINGVDIQYAIMKEVESFSMEQFGSSDSKSLLSILRNPLKLQTNIAPHYIKAVAQKVKFLGCICKTPR